MRADRVFGAMAALLLLLAATSVRHWQEIPQHPGVDFHQFWGVAKSQRDAGFRLGSPYRDDARYREALARRAQQAQDARLAAAIASRPALDLTATPFAYFLLGSWPGPYADGLAWFRAAQLAAFALALFLLARPLAAAPMAALFAVIAAAAMDPLLLEVAVGNVSSLQLLVLVAVAEALRRDDGGGRLARGWIPALLAVVVLLKPIVALAAGLLGLVLLARQRTAAARLAVVASAAATTALAVLAPALLFGGLGVWRDWWAGTFSSDARLSYDVAQGNYAGVTLLAQHAGLSIASAMAIVAAGLLLSLAAALAIVRARGPLRWRDAARETLADPLGAVAAGVILLLALSPLVWSHYQVLTVAAALWLCRAPTPADAWPRALGWATLLLAADLPRRLYQAWPELPRIVLDASHAFGWVAAWAGLLLVVAARLRA